MCPTVQSIGHHPLHMTCTGTPATRPPLQLHLPVLLRMPPPVTRPLERRWSTRRLDQLYLRDDTNFKVVLFHNEINFIESTQILPIIIVHITSTVKHK